MGLLRGPAVRAEARGLAESDRVFASRALDRWQATASRRLRVRLKAELNHSFANVYWYRAQIFRVSALK